MKQLYTTRLLYLLLIALFSFTACSDKDEDVKPADPSKPIVDPETPVVHKTPCKMTGWASADGNSNYQFEYSEKGLLSKVTTKEAYSPGTTGVITYTHNEKNQPVKMVFTENGIEKKYYSLSYENDLLSKNRVYQGGALRSTLDYTYDAAKRVIKIESGSVTYEYVYDSKGNVTEETYLDTNGHGYKTNYYDYDDKIEPYISVTGDVNLYGSFSKNNYGKITRTSYTDGKPGSSTTSLYTHEYNENKLPTKMTISNESGTSVSEILFTYKCD